MYRRNKMILLGWILALTVTIGIFCGILFYCQKQKQPDGTFVQAIWQSRERCGL